MTVKIQGVLLHGRRKIIVAGTTLCVNGSCRFLVFSASYFYVFSEVVMIGSFELVLDDYAMTGSSIAADDVSTESSDSFLGRLDLKVDLNCLSEQRNVL